MPSAGNKNRFKSNSVRRTPLKGCADLTSRGSFFRSAHPHPRGPARAGYLNASGRHLDSSTQVRHWRRWARDFPPRVRPTRRAVYTAHDDRPRSHFPLGAVRSTPFEIVSHGGVDPVNFFKYLSVPLLFVSTKKEMREKIFAFPQPMKYKIILLY